MKSAFDIDLCDPELEDEIRLLSELMVIASGAAEPLDAGTVDTLLGVERLTDLPRQRVAG